ncbi:hypothetical protein D3879_19395 [Pseudomonas cavernicola]|uniref:Uncharacterized protein n=1 Tax=Pseudomonas cavernicola TaxID=2320866 RepID=A0A418XCF0_9PSED|nr:hypothetical protein [Pseudomonas cavernicola]RJG10195.1 hypothetical protein D3879_19395 [Pseudomonas cavernicola]
MRIDGFSSSYSLDRSSRPGSAVTPFREVQREEETRREQPALPSSTQGLENTPQARRVQASYASSDSLPARPQDLLNQRSVSNRAAQALASYATTASYVGEADAPEVLGLDLYA